MVAQAPVCNIILGVPVSCMMEWHEVNRRVSSVALPPGIEWTGSGTGFGLRQVEWCAGDTAQAGEFVRRLRAAFPEGGVMFYVDELPADDITRARVAELKQELDKARKKR